MGLDECLCCSSFFPPWLENENPKLSTTKIAKNVTETPFFPAIPAWSSPGPSSSSGTKCLWVGGMRKLGWQRLSRRREALGALLELFAMGNYIAISKRLRRILAEIGAMVVTCDEKTLGLRDIYEKVASQRARCSWKSFEAYRHLKLLGYIVQRHGTPWSVKSEETCCPSESKEGSSLDNEEVLSILLQDLQINELKPMFDVYLPNSMFRKSFPGEPNFLLCILSENPPSRVELEKLEKLYGDAALKFCYVDHGRVSFFTFDKVLLPTLP